MTSPYIGIWVMLALVVIIVVTRAIPIRAPSHTTGFDRVMSIAQNLVTASEQDSNTLMALLHANSALARIDTLERLESKDTINRQCKTNYAKLRSGIEQQHRRALERIQIEAPNVAFQHAYEINAIL